MKRESLFQIGGKLEPLSELAAFAGMRELPDELLQTFQGLEKHAGRNFLFGRIRADDTKLDGRVRHVRGDMRSLRCIWRASK